LAIFPVSLCDLAYFAKQAVKKRKAYSDADSLFVTMKYEKSSL